MFYAAAESYHQSENKCRQKKRVLRKRVERRIRKNISYQILNAYRINVAYALDCDWNARQMNCQYRNESQRGENQGSRDDCADSPKRRAQQKSVGFPAICRHDSGKKQKWQKRISSDSDNNFGYERKRRVPLQIIERQNQSRRRSQRDAN